MEEKKKKFFLISHKIINFKEDVLWNVNTERSTTLVRG